MKYANFEVSELGPADYQNFLAHRKANFDMDWDGDFAQWMRRSPTRLFGIKDGNNLITSAAFTIQPDHDFIWAVSTNPAYRRKGLATKIMQHMMNQGKGIKELRVRSDNHGAQKLYKNLGFFDTGRVQPDDPNEVYYRFEKQAGITTVTPEQLMYSWYLIQRTANK